MVFIKTRRNFYPYVILFILPFILIGSNKEEMRLKIRGADFKENGVCVCWYYKKWTTSLYELIYLCIPK